MGKMRGIDKFRTYKVVYQSDSPKSRRERRMKFLTRTSISLCTKKFTRGRVRALSTNNFKAYATTR